MPARKKSADHYAELRKASGWYLAAWRDFRDLTLEALAAKVGSTKGYVSDLETGASRPGRPPRRYNRDFVDMMAQALDTTPGRLLDVDPFEMSENYERLTDSIAKLGEEDRAALLTMVEHLTARKAG